jgi:hypothetical protein
MEVQPPDPIGPPAAFCFWWIWLWWFWFFRRAR